MDELAAVAVARPGGMGDAAEAVGLEDPLGASAELGCTDTEQAASVTVAATDTASARVKNGRFIHSSARPWEYATPMSGFWSLALRWFYRLLRLIDPLVRTWYGPLGIGNTIDLVVRGRRSGRPRHILLGLLRVDGRFYLGHPNGDVAWTRNLEAAGEGELQIRGMAPSTIRPIRLAPGAERDAAIRATWRQHPFPGNLIYWLARDHIRAVGTFFRLEAPPSAAA